MQAPFSTRHDRPAMDHPYPDHAYLERDAQTDEKRWFSSKGMGVGYVHEDRVQERIDEAVAAERERCAKIADGELMEVYSPGEERVAKAIAEAIRNTI